MGALIERYRSMVDAGSHNFYGLTITRHATEIGALIARYEARSAIDVGCGRGDQYRDPYRLGKQWGLDEVRLFDPAFGTHCEPPREDEKFDAVLCCDVLEHVPEDEVDAFVAALFRHARRFVWASVCCRPAKKVFPGDKLNMHVTVKGFAWWSQKFEQAQKQRDLFVDGAEVPFFLIETP